MRSHMCAVYEVMAHSVVTPSAGVQIAEVPSIMHMTANVASLFESGKTDAVEVWLREVLGQVEKVNPDFVSM